MFNASHATLGIVKNTFYTFIALRHEWNANTHILEWYNAEIRMDIISEKAKI